jgi:hypothetical protein
VYTGLQEIVELLSYTQQSHDGYKQFVAHVEREPLTPKQIFCIQNQCLYLRTAYSIPVVGAMPCGAIDCVIFLLKLPWSMVYYGSHPRSMRMAPVVGVVGHDLINTRR